VDSRTGWRLLADAPERDDLGAADTATIQKGRRGAKAGAQRCGVEEAGGYAIGAGLWQCEEYLSVLAVCADRQKARERFMACRVLCCGGRGCERGCGEKKSERYR
jgi:hypothetical protein